MTSRETFLIKIYEQMFNDIDRHHKIVWQVIGVLVGSFAIVALTEKKVIPIDIAVTIFVMISLWVIAHVYDSNYWYNRNLVIISNIERQFLIKEDLKDIHYYFGEHRSKNAIQTSLKIQLYLVISLMTIMLLYHFFEQIVPGFKYSFEESEINLLKIMPYASSLILYFVLVRWIKKKRENNYLEFLENSPGAVIDTSKIKYGDGHPIQIKQDS